MRQKTEPERAEELGGTETEDRDRRQKTAGGDERELRENSISLLPHAPLWPPFVPPISPLAPHQGVKSRYFKLTA